MFFLLVKLVSSFSIYFFAERAGDRFCNPGICGGRSGRGWSFCQAKSQKTGSNGAYACILSKALGLLRASFFLDSSFVLLCRDIWKASIVEAIGGETL